MLPVISVSCAPLMIVVSVVSSLHERGGEEARRSWLACGPCDHGPSGEVCHHSSLANAILTFAREHEDTTSGSRQDDHTKCASPQ